MNGKKQQSHDIVSINHPAGVDRTQTIRAPKQIFHDYYNPKPSEYSPHRIYHSHPLSASISERSKQERKQFSHAHHVDQSMTSRNS
mmetsp:Transcript_19385/g.28485  ORF Transcript_19385/g.28485 Transcript_19385/m.28485 type:complete len:86 (-) Transcript_19385:13-270(-)